jgi:3-hydroxybutyryl-CoA dehydrogenase
MMKVAVIGSGTMGNGIAHVFGQYGYKVSLIDISAEALQQALITIQKNLNRQVEKEIITEEIKAQAIKNIVAVSDLKAGVEGAGLIVEAATESRDLKLKIFKDVDGFAAPDAILASNTSSISITTIASATKRPDRVVGMHFMNPVPLMKLVEVIRGKHTSNEVTEKIMALSRALGKSPVEVNDAPGFVANRILMPMINEAIYALSENVSGVEEIDAVMKLGMSHPMGPLQLADFIGLDVCLFILNVLHEGFDTAKYTPCPLLVEMVKDGQLGIKSKQGFYQYQSGNKDLVVSDRFKKHFRKI